MKRDYQEPSVEVVQMTIHQHLLSGSNINGNIGDHATKPAKSRRGATWDDDDWDEDWDDEWDDDDDDDYNNWG